MRLADLQLRDLSPDDIDELTRLLSRRPDYGIGRPTARWLIRQEKKVGQLPKTLLSPRNMLQRFAIGLASRYDAQQRDADKILPPSAVLCDSHERLNGFLIRDIFLTITLELSGDWMAALRAWEGKNPAVAAFLTRMDSLHAFWVSKEAFHAIFGTTPHDDRYVRIKSNCEACILAALGANGRVLSDLYGWAIMRKEDNQKFNDEARARGSSRRRSTVLLRRLVDAWIAHLKPEDEDRVQRRGEDVAMELRNIWSAISKTKDNLSKRKQKRKELHLNKDGTTHWTETRSKEIRGYGIPLPKADHQAAGLQRNMAGLDESLDLHSVYRADTVVEGPSMHRGKTTTNYLHTRLATEPLISESQRPSAPEPPSERGAPSVGAPDATFISRFAAEVPIAPQHQMSNGNEFSNGDHHRHHDERGYDADVESATEIRNWYDRQAASTTSTNLDQLDKESIHPAFRTDDPPMTSRSAVPPSLQLQNSGGKTLYKPPRADWPKTSTEETTQQIDLANVDTKSVWTDVSVYTTADAFDGFDFRGATGMPAVPAEYRVDQNDGYHAPTDATTSVPGLTPDRGSGRWPASSDPRSYRVTPDDHDGDPFSPYGASRAPHPQAFTRPQPRQPQSKTDRRKDPLGGDSDSVSQLTLSDKKYVPKNKGIIKDVSPRNNPFVRQDSTRSKMTLDKDDKGLSPTTPKRNDGSVQPRYEGYAALNREVAERQHGSSSQARNRVYDSDDNGPLTPRAKP